LPTFLLIKNGKIKNVKNAFFYFKIKKRKNDFYIYDTKQNKKHSCRREKADRTPVITANISERLLQQFALT